MTYEPPKAGLPPITIAIADHDRLTAVAEAAARREIDAAEELLFELERADVVADGAVPDGVVRMGSTVTYCGDGGAVQTVTLVYPADAEISEMKVSVLTPIGAALIGMRAGQSIAWTDRADRQRGLTVIAVC